MVSMTIRTSRRHKNQDYYLHRFAVNGKSHGLSPPKKIHWWSLIRLARGSSKIQFSPIWWNNFVSHFTPDSLRWAASSLWRCSSANLAAVAPSMWLTLRPYVTSRQSLRLSNLPWSATFLHNFSWIFIRVTSTNTSFFPVCSHFAIILPFHSPSTRKNGFFWLGARTSAVT